MFIHSCRKQNSHPQTSHSRTSRSWSTPMKRLALVGLSLCAVVTPVASGESLRLRPAAAGVVQDFDPTSPDLHEYAPPTPAGRGHGNAYLGAGYLEFLYSGSGSRPPRLPPRRVYVGPVESEPYENRRLQLRQGMSPRAG